ncbi:ABC transporter ATP-binding protein [Vallitaleaceae bacterium 9-2]
MQTLEKLKKLIDINIYRILYQYTNGYRSKIMLITSLSILQALLNVLIAFITKMMIDYAIDGNYIAALRSGIFFALLLIIDLSLYSLLSHNSVKLENTMINDLQLKVLTKIYHKKWATISQYNTGDLLTRLYEDVRHVIQSITTIIPTMIALLLQFVAAFAMLAYFDWLLAMLTFLITPFTVLISLIIGRKLRDIQYKIQNADGIQRSKINESLQNLILLKTFNFLHENLFQISTLQNNRFKLIKHKNITSIKANVILESGYNVGFFFALTLGAYRLAQSAISFGTFTAFLQLVGEIQGPIHEMTRSIPRLISSLSSLERIEEIIALPDETSQNHYTINENETINGLHIHNLSFAYDENTRVLDKVNLSITSGRRIGIIGPSGSGKTTLIHLVLSLIEPSEGSLFISFDSGKKLPLTFASRNYFSYVSQSNPLFSGSLRENLFLNETITPDQIQTALTAACCDEFIRQLDNGIDSFIHERGVGISQGQAQRINIARALVHNKPFLILDEATSSLDRETERQLIRNITHYYPNTTLIAITHGTQLLTICDEIYEIKEKQLVPAKAYE